MELEAKLLLFDAFKTFKKVLVMAFRAELPNPKDSKTSDEKRKKGNVLFLEKIHSHELHKKILSHYNESAALAPSGSQELAFAYANRSAFLLHVGKYKECTQDVEKALEITESNELKIKLLCRKVECLKKLGSTCENALEEVKNLLNFFDGDDDKKQKLNEMVTAALLVDEKKDTSHKTSESVYLPVTDNVLEKVSIKHNEKYKRHLVAGQDYNPGDVIFVEKLFAKSVKPPHRYTNCHHCLKDCWTGVPCDYCNWAIFCSEDCRQEAWKEYHDIECAVGDLLNFVSDVPWIPWSMSIKIFIKAMKDAGSVENLRAQLEAVDQCTDLCSKGFYKDGKFNNYTIESFYSLTKKKFSLLQQKIHPQIALITLVGLLKHPLLKGIFSIKKVRELTQNKDLVFLGSLLIKFTAIRLNNCFSFIHYMSIFNNKRNNKVSRSIRGSCLAVLASLINSSCCPNANVCFTEGGKIIVYALQPMKKDSQIFISYTNEYYSKSLEDRKKEIKNYNFECDCEACTESWPALLLNQVLENENGINDGADSDFLDKCDDIIKAMMNEDYSKATLEKLVERITVAFKCLKQPSPITCIMFDGLNSCVTNLYNGLKPQMFGNCKKLE